MKSNMKDRDLCVTLLAICVLYGQVNANCSDNVPELHSLNLRSVTHALETSDPHIKDGLLDNGWYSVQPDGSGAYRMSSASEDGIPQLGHCGTLNPIYLDGTLPSFQEGVEYDLKACYVTWDSDCSYEPVVKVRMCSGRVQYYLTSPEGVSGYCFEHPEPAAPPDYDLPNRPVVSVGMTYILAPQRPNIRLPHLEFTCDATQDSRWFYLVQWFVRVGHNDALIRTSGLTKDLSTTILSEADLSINNITLGTTITCAISVASTQDGHTTDPTFSEGFFIGIKLMTPTLDVNNGDRGTLRLRQTVPFGCVYFGVNLDCELSVSLYNVDKSHECSQKAVAVHNPKHCGTSLTGWDYQNCQNGCRNFQGRDIELSVTTKQTITYQMAGTFEVLLQTEDSGVSHSIWKNYNIENARVNVLDRTSWKSKSCRATADPRMTTFDGRYYSATGAGNVGEFILYKHTTEPIQVQYKTYTCAWRETCICAVIIQSGGDLWMYSTCNISNYIGFLSCNDGTLYAQASRPGSSLEYKIHTPIGTTITVTLKYDRDWFLNVVINASPTDFNHTIGHCGTLNGNHADDFTNRDGTVLFSSFYQSWRLESTESFFNTANHNLPTWDKEQYTCVCLKEGNAEPEILCSPDKTSVCITNPGSPVCNPRRKRSVNSHKQYIDMVFEKIRGDPSDTIHFEDDRGNVSYTEAYDTCRRHFESKQIYSLKDNVPDARLEESLSACTSDAMVDITKTTWRDAHFESWVKGIESEIERNITFKETYPNTVAAFEMINCPDECNHQGQCIEGTCQCDEDYSGASCFIRKSAELTIDYIEEGCDVTNADCFDCFMLKTEMLAEDFWCQILSFDIGHDNQVHVTGNHSNFGEYENIFEGTCCLHDDQKRRRRSVENSFFVTEHRFAVSNDGIHYGPSRKVYIYDSTCQEYVVLPNGDWLFSLKADTCFIDGLCYKTRQQQTSSPCSNVCSPENARYSWSLGCNNAGGNSNDSPGGSDEGIDGGHLVLIVAITITGLVVFGVIVVIVIWQKKRPQRTVSTIETNKGEEEPPTYFTIPANTRYK